MSKVWIAAGIVLAAIVGFTIGQSFSLAPSFDLPVIERINPSSDQPKDVSFAQFWQVWNEVHDKFYSRDKIVDEDMVFGAIKGMVRASGDKYGEFFTPVETKNFLDTITGSFEGIGAEIGTNNGNIIIVAPLKGTPAEAAGIRPKDIVLKIDDEATFEMSLERAVSLIKGPRGTEVVLTISRKDLEQPLEVKIKRARIEVPTVASELKEPGLGYIEIRTFSDNTPQKFRGAVQALLKQDIRKLILDLRNDPGGLLQAAVEVGSVFTGPNKVIAIEKQISGEPVEHSTTQDALLKGVKIVVIVNEGTASAAEILAGALRDHLQIPVIGAVTFGKGSVQSYSEFDNGASLKITTAHWFTPRGDSIEGQGLKPDLAVSDLPDTEIDEALEKALELIRLD